MTNTVHRAVTPVFTTGAAPACLRAAPSVSDMLLHPLAWLKRRLMLRRLEAHRRANYAANADYRKRRTAARLGIDRAKMARDLSA